MTEIYSRSYKHLRYTDTFTHTFFLHCWTVGCILSVHPFFYIVWVYLVRGSNNESGNQFLLEAAELNCTFLLQQPYSANAEALQACGINGFPVDETNASPELTGCYNTYWTMQLVNLLWIYEYINVNTNDGCRIAMLLDRKHTHRGRSTAGASSGPLNFGSFDSSIDDLWAAVFWGTDSLMHTHTLSHTHTHTHTHRKAVTPVFLLFFSIYHWGAESATSGLWCHAVWATACTLWRSVCCLPE